MIEVYTSPTCIYCHALLDWFDELGVDYEELDATKDPTIHSVPVTKIGDTKIVGFDRPALKRALKNANII